MRIVLAYLMDPGPWAPTWTDPEHTRFLRTPHVQAAGNPGAAASAGSDPQYAPVLPLTAKGSHVMTSLDHATMKSNLTSSSVGEHEVNDLEAVLTFRGPQRERRSSVAVVDNCPAEFTWDYEKGAKPQLERLYETAKKAQWNGQTDLDWSIEVDQERVVVDNAAANPEQAQWDPAGLAGTVAGEVGDRRQWLRVRHGAAELDRCSPSSGTANRVPCCARPRASRRCRGSTPSTTPPPRWCGRGVRHVEVFSKYLDTKLSGHYPMNGPTSACSLDDIVSDSRWDMTYLGMQIMVEGLALAALGFIHATTTEPLLKKLLRYVMSDEARHVAFGVLSLQDYYKELSAAELRERQEFAFEAAIRMKDRLIMQEVWERLEVPTADVVQVLSHAPDRDDFQILFCSPRSCRTCASSGSSTPPMVGCGPSSPKWGPSRSSTSRTRRRKRTRSRTDRRPSGRWPDGALPGSGPTLSLGTARGDW